MRTQSTDPLQLRLLDDPSAGTVKLPASTVRMLLPILEAMARSNAVTRIPEHAERTTQEAADMLNISRPSLIPHLDKGNIEFRRRGTRRRVRFEALRVGKRRLQAARGCRTPPSPRQTRRLRPGAGALSDEERCRSASIMRCGDVHCIL